MTAEAIANRAGFHSQDFLKANKIDTAPVACNVVQVSCNAFLIPLESFLFLRRPSRIRAVEKSEKKE